MKEGGRQPACHWPADVKARPIGRLEKCKCSLCPPDWTRLFGLVSGSVVLQRAGVLANGPRCPCEPRIVGKTIAAADRLTELARVRLTLIQEGRPAGFLFSDEHLP